MSFTLPTWTAGLPPGPFTVALACRKWAGFHNDQYIEVVAGDPSVFLETIGASVVLHPGVTVFTGKVIHRGDIPYILNEYGAPAGCYPDSIIAWSHMPDGLNDLSAAATTSMIVSKAKTN
ncbi:hypothetical protein [Acidovorax sp.]|uniref:hypothetical protein n=1 Tax=Acidovorax sp. TaxID=1872122 RepID=UPI00391FB2E3